MKKLYIGAFAALLVGAVMLQLLGWRNDVSVSKGVHLGAMLARAMTGVPGRDLPLGATEAGDDNVRSVLQCDDVFYRSYSTNQGEFQVYIAYWGANKVPSQLVASHTPDRCWSDNGWRCIDMKFQQIYFQGDHELVPGEWRVFLPPNGVNRVNVIYWHIVSGKPYHYRKGFNWVPNPFEYWKQHASYLTFGSGEQYFVRITSERPFELFWLDTSFQKMLACLADPILGAK